MLTDQIIEFGLKEPGPLVEHLVQNPIIFMIKQKFPKQILEQLFTAKILQEAMYLVSLTWAKSFS